MDQTITLDLISKLNLLYSWLSLRTCVVAFSGGVDSATLAKALVLVNQTQTMPNSKVRPLALLAESLTTTKDEITEAKQIAKEIGIELQILHSNEFKEPCFVENSPNRCYWCKKIRFKMINTFITHELLPWWGENIVIIDGSNMDDKNDYRPGIQAARELGILSPFTELGITKSDIRTLASVWGLSFAQKPSNSCLATRLAYYLPLREEILHQIEVAERILRTIFGSIHLRARVDTPGIVRIEVPEELIGKVVIPKVRFKLIKELRKVGFKFVTLDLEGFFSGKNNRIG